MAFSLKSLLGGRKKSASPDMDGDDDPFMSSGPEEITEAEAMKMEMESAAKKAGSKKRKKGGLLSSVTGLFGRKGKNKKQKSASEPDPFDNPELMALIASEVAAIPMPDEVAQEDVEPEATAAPVVDEPPPPTAPAVDDDELLDDDQSADDEDIPAFMNKSDREYEGMADFAMPDASKSVGYNGDEDEVFGDGFALGGMDDDDRPGSGGRGRGGMNTKKIAALAAGIVVLAGGGAAWWMMGDDSAGHDMAAREPLGSLSGQMGELSGGGVVPQALPGDRVSMAMPPAPPTQSDDSTARGDERSTARRPWLTDGTTPLGPTGAAPAGEQTAEANPETTPDGSGDGHGDGPSDGLGEQAGHLTVEPAPQDAPADGHGEPQTAEAGDGAAAPEGTGHGDDAQVAHAEGGAAQDGEGHSQGADSAPESSASNTPAPAATRTTPLGPLAELPPLEVPDLPGIPEGRLTPPSYEKLPKPREQAAGLSVAPDTSISRQTAMGLLPVRSADGKTAWQTYARPFKGDPNTPRIALVVVGLGLDPIATAAAITSLPPDVTLAFSPYAPNLKAQMAAARAAGHEVLLDLPMEPVDFPARDPGPLAMLTVHGPADNISRLEMALGKGIGYTGVVNRMGTKFMASPDAMRPVLEALQQRGLIYVNNQPEAAGVSANADVNLPFAEALLTVDESPFREAIDTRLAYLTDAAKKRGQVVAILNPTPLSFERVISWSQGLAEQGLLLAPVSAAVRGES